MCLGSSSSSSERGKIKNQRESEQGRDVGVSEIDSWGGGGVKFEVNNPVVYFE